MKIGKRSIKFDNTPIIISAYAVVGPKEKAGPISSYFDETYDDVYLGEKTFEKAEQKFMNTAVTNAISTANFPISDIDYILAGDLLNQCITSGYAMREFDIPFLGLYGACSTFSEANILASILIDSGNAKRTVAVASSHFCSAERQFRLPLEQGTQTPSTGQWTVTGSGATVLKEYTSDEAKNNPCVTYATVGKVIDLGINDVANMGASMMPAAFDTLLNHFQDTQRNPDYYDLIVTGDLGELGSNLLKDQLLKHGYDISKVYNDCGLIIFDNLKQDTAMGGSGCGCSATVFSGYIYKLLKEKKINKVLLVATGALMSPVSLGQGETIPGIAHAIAIENLEA